MSEITLRILDGADRGRVYESLPTPVSIGREEGNTIQLNDERVSRFHVKIQQDHDRIVLTDLESTNGTKVNGEDVQLRILRFGDMIGIGRSVLLFGSRDQIASRLAHLKGDNANAASTGGSEASHHGESSSSFDLDFELMNHWYNEPELQATIYSLEPPELPERLSPGQAAQLSELLEYFHLRIRSLISTAHVDTKGGRVTLDLHQWQNLVDLHARLAEYLRMIGDPGT